METYFIYSGEADFSFRLDKEKYKQIVENLDWEGELTEMNINHYIITILGISEV